MEKPRQFIAPESGPAEQILTENKVAENQNESAPKGPFFVDSEGQTSTKLGEESTPVEIPVESLVESDVLEGPEVPPAPEGGPVVSDLTESGKNIWQRMSEGGKELASKAYEGLYKIPGVRRVVGKMEIAYNQFFADKHEAKAAKFLDKMSLKNDEIDQIKANRQTAEQNIQELESRGVATSSLKLKLKIFDRQENQLLNQHDKLQTKFEARKGRAELYTDERNQIAEKLIGKYDESLKPMESELDKLKEKTGELEVINTLSEFKYAELEQKITQEEATRDRILDTLQLMGTSERRAKRDESVRAITKRIASSRKEIQQGRDNLQKQRAEINNKIAKVDEKANPYRDKVREFRRVQDGKPLEGMREVPIRPRETEPRVETASVFRARYKPQSPEEQELLTRYRLSDLVAAWENTLEGDENADKRRVFDRFRSVIDKNPTFAAMEMSAKAFAEAVTQYYKAAGLEAFSEEKLEMAA